jgi:hypothetical protein
MSTRGNPDFDKLAMRSLVPPKRLQSEVEEIPAVPQLVTVQVDGESVTIDILEGETFRLPPKDPEPPAVPGPGKDGSYWVQVAPGIRVGRLSPEEQARMDRRLERAAYERARKVL